MKRTRVRIKHLMLAAVFVFASAISSFAIVDQASALTLTWTGAGDGVSFSDTDNWSSATTPLNSDVLVFNASTISSSTTLNNDVSNLSLNGINFTGSPSSSASFIIGGNPITLNGNVTNNSTYSGQVLPHTLDVNVALGANVTMTNVHFASGKLLNLQTNNLTWAGNWVCALGLSGNLSGTGSLNMTASLAAIGGNNSSFGGPVSISQGMVLATAQSFGNANGSTAVSGEGRLLISIPANTTLNEPFTLGGSGYIGSSDGSVAGNGCSGGGVPTKRTLTLAGGVTLQSNFKLNSFNDVVVTGTYNANGHTFTVQSGSTGTLKLPGSGTVEAPSETTQFNGDQPNQNQILQNKQTGILNGTRNSIYVGNGGILKGTGMANVVSVSGTGIINPGNSPGTMTILETLSGDGTYQFEILNKDSYDRLIVGEDYSGSGSAVNLYSGSKLDVILYDGWSIKNGDSFMIVDNKSSTDVQGTFNGLDEGEQFEVDGITFSITYEGGDGNDVVITALNSGNDPDPSNTGIASFVGSPLALIAMGVATAGILFLIARRRLKV